MNVLVMGLGEVAHACSLSLLASCNVAQVTMVGRDRELLQEVQSTGHVRVGRVILPKPPRLCLSSYEDVLSHGGAGHDAVFVCTAATALFPGIYELARCTTAASGASFTERSHSPFFAALTTALRTEGNAGSSAASKSHRPLFVFTRGCSVDGRFPATALKHAFPQVPVVAVSGPVLPREWMAEAHTRENSGGATVRERQTCASASRGEVSSVGCPSVSPTSLAFAEVVAEGGVADQESNGGPRVAGIEAMAAALFPHESTTWLTYPAAAATLSFVNACTLLCAVGAGMVSNEYPASVSAQMSFLQHATTAINEVLNQLAWLAPAAGSTALPPVAMATLAMACSNLSSREFSLGRRLDFHFKKTAATDAVFQRGSSQERSLAMTMEGVYAFLSDRHIRSPFFEVILDSYSTMLRASVAGRGLVKTGVYDYVTKSAEGSELLRAALRVDEAMLSGSERSFEDAKRELAARFSPRARTAGLFVERTQVGQAAGAVRTAINAVSAFKFAPVSVQQLLSPSRHAGNLEPLGATSGAPAATPATPAPAAAPPAASDAGATSPPETAAAPIGGTVSADSVQPALGVAAPPAKVGPAASAPVGSLTLPATCPLTGLPLNPIPGSFSKAVQDAFRPCAVYFIGPVKKFNRSFSKQPRLCVVGDGTVNIANPKNGAVTKTFAVRYATEVILSRSNAWIVGIRAVATSRDTDLLLEFEGQKQRNDFLTILVRQAQARGVTLPARMLDEQNKETYKAILRLNSKAGGKEKYVVSLRRLADVMQAPGQGEVDKGALITVLAQQQVPPAGVLAAPTGNQAPAVATLPDLIAAEAVTREDITLQQSAELLGIAITWVRQVGPGPLKQSLTALLSSEDLRFHAEPAWSGVGGGNVAAPGECNNQPLEEIIPPWRDRPVIDASDHSKWDACPNCVRLVAALTHSSPNGSPAERRGLSRRNNSRRHSVSSRSSSRFDFDDDFSSDDEDYDDDDFGEYTHGSRSRSYKGPVRRRSQSHRSAGGHGDEGEIYSVRQQIAERDEYIRMLENKVRRQKREKDEILDELNSREIELGTASKTILEKDRKIQAAVDSVAQVKAAKTYDDMENSRVASAASFRLKDLEQRVSHAQLEARAEEARRKQLELAVLEHPGVPLDLKQTMSRGAPGAYSANSSGRAPDLYESPSRHVDPTATKEEVEFLRNLLRQTVTEHRQEITDFRQRMHDYEAQVRNTLRAANSNLLTHSSPTPDGRRHDSIDLHNDENFGSTSDWHNPSKRGRGIAFPRTLSNGWTDGIPPPLPKFGDQRYPNDNVLGRKSSGDSMLAGGSFPHRDAAPASNYWQRTPERRSYY